MKPDQIAALRKRLQLSQGEFGRALGYQDGRRRVRAWETGYRNGEPSGPPESALLAIRYLTAIVDSLEDGLTAPQIRDKLVDALPEFMKDKA